MSNRYTNKKIKELEAEIKSLKQSLDITIDLNEVLQQNNNKLDKERINYRRIIKYHTLVLIIMNLVSRYTSCNDMGTVIETCINGYYKELTAALMNIPGDNSIDNFEDNEFDDGEYEENSDGEDEF
jgi:hypothetical protein